MSIYRYNLEFCYATDTFVKRDSWRWGDILLHGKQTYVFLGWSETKFARWMLNGQKLIEIEMDAKFPAKKIV